ncbi:MAG: Hsp20/alpha crystallin family protein [Verrucomicrobiota bacterium]
MTLFKTDLYSNDPFAGMNSLFEHFNRSFGGSFGVSSRDRQIPVNLYSADDAYNVRAEVPGFSKEEVTVELENAVLEIRAQKKSSEDGSTNSVQLVRKITIGDDVDPQKVTAKLENGVLSVHLPKNEATKPKSIEVS